MSDDFQKLIEEIEAEAKAEGLAAEAELRDLRREFSAEAKLMASANRSPGDRSQRRRAPRP
jgi:hypothetical protein